VSCPSCGRTLFDLQEISAQIREKTAHLPGVAVCLPSVQIFRYCFSHSKWVVHDESEVLADRVLLSLMLMFALGSEIAPSLMHCR
jgi:hypothetical protein